VGPLGGSNLREDPAALADSAEAFPAPETVDSDDTGSSLQLCAMAM